MKEDEFIDSSFWEHKAKIIRKRRMKKARLVYYSWLAFVIIFGFGGFPTIVIGVLLNNHVIRLFGCVHMGVLIGWIITDSLFGDQSFNNLFNWGFNKAEKLSQSPSANDLKRDYERSLVIKDN